jgi:hypothetical protein
LEHHQIVDLNVLLIQIVHLIRLVLQKSVGNPVMDLVDLIQSAECRIISQFVLAVKDSQVTHLINVSKLLKMSQKSPEMIHVIHLHVVQMLIATMVNVYVYLITLGMHIKDVDQNAL